MLWILFFSLIGIFLIRELFGLIACIAGFIFALVGCLCLFLMSIIAGKLQ